MLRDRRDEAPAGRQGRVDGAYHSSIILDVLKHIVGSYQIERIARGNTPRIHLHEGSTIAKPYSCMLEAGRVKLGAGHA
ncbi:MAG: hypothetical protein JO105_01540 [Hyphomicrobiales bacterium]|nr:hypothetical protein [Acidobacteriaceae bacterium]MBV9974057.1 hypothetical protein [Hyphomicrobiales bacterium]